MNETIVAVYDTPAHAAMAVADLEMAGIPRDCIESHAENATPDAAPVQHGPVGGLWASLFGDHVHVDQHVFHHSLANGSVVVTVRGGTFDPAQAATIMESHAPIDMDQRAADYGLPQTPSKLVNLGGPRIRRFRFEA